MIIQQRFIEKRRTLALAESCTGGGIAARLVATPDCSRYFQGGCVAYSNHAKEKILHVKRATLEKYGAVSEETAREMAHGALGAFETDFALATTGSAGPVGEKVGIVCFAIVSLHRQPLAWRTHFLGERSSVIEQAIADALDHLYDYVV